MGLLDGKRALIVGVGNQRSIAWGIATSFQREGARLAFTYLNDRFKDNVTKLVDTLPDHESMPVLLCDAAKADDVASLISEIDRRWGGLDILVHSIAFAPVDDLKGRFHEISRDGVLMAVEISAYTLVSLSRAALPLFTKAGGGSVMTLTYNAVERVVPSYNSMAIAKAALETCVRYLADIELSALHTPGHTEGSTCFYLRREGTLFSGDLLFKGNIGRTDLPGSDPTAMAESLSRVASSLPATTRVLPGHGAETTIGAEIATLRDLRDAGILPELKIASR